MRSDADFIILEGGVNNGGAAPNFGVVSSGYAKSTIDNFDDYYFTPAFEKMLVNVLNRFPGKKIGYIFVHKMSTYYSSNGDESNKYYLAKKCCEKWGIPYIDLNTEVPAFGLFPTDGDSGLAYLRAHYTNNGDGWHPNEEGYKKYYCDKIEAWLKTL
jgi:lysophospholipase L1-like esterase